MRCGTIGSCQSAATFEIVKAAGRESDSCKRHCNKCPDLYLYCMMCLNSQQASHLCCDTAMLTESYAPYLLTCKFVGQRYVLQRRVRRCGEVSDPVSRRRVRTLGHLQPDDRLLSRRHGRQALVLRETAGTVRVVDSSPCRASTGHIYQEYQGIFTDSWTFLDFLYS